MILIHVQLFVIIIGKMQPKPDDSCMNYQCKKIYLLYDLVHLIKNTKNKLLSCKRFIIPSFTFDGFRNFIDLQSDGILYKIFHNTMRH